MWPFKSREPDIAAMKSKQDFAGLVTVMLRYGNRGYSGRHACQALLEITAAQKEQATDLLAANLSTIEAWHENPKLMGVGEVGRSGISFAFDCVVRCLGRTGDPRAFDILLPLYQQNREAFQLHQRDPRAFLQQNSVKIGGIHPRPNSAIVEAFQNLKDRRAAPLLAEWLESLIDVERNSPPPSMREVSAGYGLLNEIRGMVDALGSIGDPSVIPVLEMCRTIEAVGMDADARSNNQRFVKFLREHVDDAIRALTGSVKTPEEIERELHDLIWAIGAGEEDAGALRRRLVKLGPSAVPILDRIIAESLPTLDATRRGNSAIMTAFLLAREQR